MISDIILIGKRAVAQEAQALSALADSLDGSFVDACDAIFECRGTVLLTGMGKSGLVARKWASTFSSTGTRAYFVNPAEAPHGDLGVVREGDLLVALSFSGETEELGYVLRHAAETKIKTLAVTGNPQSSLARAADIVVSVALSEEACPLGLAPTTSSTVMMALGDALAITLMQRRGFTERDFARLHPGGSLGRKLWLRVTSLMHSGASLPVVGPEDNLEHTLLEITRKCLGLAVVVEDGKILGVITDGDLRRFFQSPGRGNGSVTARELMTKQPKLVDQESLAVEAREMMEKNSIHQLIVTRGAERELVGVLHLHDLLRAKVL